MNSPCLHYIASAVALIILHRSRRALCARAVPFARILFHYKVGRKFRGPRNFTEHLFEFPLKVLNFRFRHFGTKEKLTHLSDAIRAHFKKRASP